MSSIKHGTYRDPKLTLGGLERESHIVLCVGLNEGLIVDQVGSMLVDERAAANPSALLDGEETSQAKSVAPGALEVSDVDAVVPGRVPLAPEQETGLCVRSLLTSRRQRDQQQRQDVLDPSNHESLHQTPNQAQDELEIPIHDVCRNLVRSYSSQIVSTYPRARCW